MAGTAWIVAPWAARSIPGPNPPIKALLVGLTAGLVWQFALVLVLVAREQHSVHCFNSTFSNFNNVCQTDNATLVVSDLRKLPPRRCLSLACPVNLHVAQVVAELSISRRILALSGVDRRILSY
jgi:hypothetical protein